MLVAINQIRQFASLPPLLLWTESGPGFINKGLIANSGFCEGFRVRMAQASYSFIDVAALTEVRERFAAGDALVILSGDLEEVIWANGPGAALFGHAEVEAILGVEAPLGAAAKRQIAATSGFPDIGRDRALMLRIATGVSSQALPLLASAVALPDGEQAILLAQPAPGGTAGTQGVAERAIGGFAAAGHFLAFVDAEGAVEAASPGFARLGLTQDALAGMAREATSHRPVIKRRLTGRRGPLPAGLARLTDAKRLLVVIDDGYAEEDAAVSDETVDAVGDATAAVPAVEQADAAGAASDPAREIWYLGSEGTAQAEAGEPAAIEPEPAGSGEPQQTIEEVVLEAGDETEAHQTEVEPELHPRVGRRSCLRGRRLPATGRPSPRLSTKPPSRS